MAHAFIAMDNAKAARRQVQLIKSAVLGLARFPEMGRPGQHLGTRELVVNGTAYIVAYEITDQTIDILRVMHGMRRWPDSL